MIKALILFLLFSSLNSVSFAQSGVKAGDKAPLLSVDEWLKGEPVYSFEDGKVYLVEFWGTWCSPCIKNIPHLSELEKKYSGNGLVVIGVATHEINGRDKLDQFMKDRGNAEMEYRVAYDSDLTMERDWDTGETGGNNFRLPVCFLIDKSGSVVFVGHPGDKKLESMIESTIDVK